MIECGSLAELAVKDASNFATPVHCEMDRLEIFKTIVPISTNRLEWPGRFVFTVGA